MHNIQTILVTPPGNLTIVTLSATNSVGTGTASLAFTEGSLPPADA